MKISGIFFAVLLGLFICFLPSKILAKDDWVKVRSKNFQLVGNAAETDIRAVTSRLEQFREVFRQLFPDVNLNSPIPTNVVIFKNDESFRNYKPVDDEGKSTDWVAGYFRSGADANYIVLSTEGKIDDAYRVIFHEYVHFLVDNNIGRGTVPPWFNEGLAEYYALFQIEDDRKITLGGANENKLRLLRQSKLIPFETFFNTDYYTLHRQGKDGAGLFYAQAWALMSYLKQNDGGEKTSQLKGFLKLILDGKTPKKAFQEAFLVDYAKLETELKKFIDQKAFKPSVTTLKSKLTFENEIQALPLAETDADAVLGDLLYHMNRLDEAAARLEEALKLDPNSSLANTSLGLVKMRRNDFDEAKKYLEKAVALDVKNYLAQYQYAYVLSREGMTDLGFVSGYTRALADKMRESLKKAIALNPDFAESYNLYALVSVVRNEDIEQATTYINRALKLAPGNQWYLMRFAELCMRREEFSDARDFAQKVYQTASEDSLRLYANNTIYLINSLESQLKEIEFYKKHPELVVDAPDKPLTEAELAEINEQHLLVSVNRMLRTPKKGEKRVLGYLTKIECQPTRVVYSIRADNQVLRLDSENFDSLILITFDGEMSNGQVGCETLKKENFVVVNYRPNEKDKTAGEIVSIEFVPKNFRLL